MVAISWGEKNRAPGFSERMGNGPAAQGAGRDRWMSQQSCGYRSWASLLLGCTARGERRCLWAAPAPAVKWGELGTPGPGSIAFVCSVWFWTPGRRLVLFGDTKKQQHFAFCLWIEHQSCEDNWFSFKCSLGVCFKNSVLNKYVLFNKIFMLDKKQTWGVVTCFLLPESFLVRVFSTIVLSNSAQLRL